MTTQKGDSVTLQLWDTAGQERFRSLVPSYIRNTHCVVLVFDVCSTESFANLNAWYQQIVDCVEGIESKTIVMVGNKVDLKEQRAVSSEEMEEKQHELHVDFMMEISAKSGHNVEELFDQIANAMPSVHSDKSKTGHFKMEKSVDFDENERQKKGCSFSSITSKGCPL